jgi:enoyl-CoA hydratase/carnithine racemase
MIRKETDGRLAVIRIERPAKRNAIDRVTTGEFDELNDFQDDPGTGPGILTGTADVFCAGNGHRVRPRWPHATRRASRRTARLRDRLREPARRTGPRYPVALNLAEEVCASSPASVRSTVQALE